MTHGRTLPDRLGRMVRTLAHRSLDRFDRAIGLPDARPVNGAPRRSPVR